MNSVCDHGVSFRWLGTLLNTAMTKTADNIFPQPRLILSGGSVVGIRRRGIVAGIVCADPGPSHLASTGGVGAEERHLAKIDSLMQAMLARMALYEE